MNKLWLNEQIMRCVPHINQYQYHLNKEMSHDFQQCGILTSVDSDEPVQPPFKLRDS